LQFIDQKSVSPHRGCDFSLQARRPVVLISESGVGATGPGSVFKFPLYAPGYDEDGAQGWLPQCSAPEWKIVTQPRAQRNFFSIDSRLTEPRAARFSPAADVIAF
jgi:hypothetical protein